MTAALSRRCDYRVGKRGRDNLCTSLFVPLFDPNIILKPLYALGIKKKTPIDESSDTPVSVGGFKIKATPVPDDLYHTYDGVAQYIIICCFFVSYCTDGFFSIYYSGFSINVK